MGPSHVPVEIIEMKKICLSTVCDIVAGRSFSSCQCVTNTQEPSSEDLTQSLPQARVNGDLA